MNQKSGQLNILCSSFIQLYNVISYIYIQKFSSYFSGKATKQAQPNTRNERIYTKQSKKYCVHPHIILCIIIIPPLLLFCFA